MTGQTKFRSRTCPGFFPAGVRIDEADHAVAMFAVVMAQKSILILDLAAYVPGS